MNKKKGLEIVLILLVIGVCCLAFIKKSNNNNCENCSVDTNDIEGANTTDVRKAKNFNIVYSGETKQYNAYDFIIEKMSQAQYWTYEQHEPVYNFTYNYDYDLVTNSKPAKAHNIINGTGFILYDEESASFVRGFEGRLIINFSEYKAISDSWFNNNPNNESDIRDLLDTNLESEYSMDTYEYNKQNSDTNDEYIGTGDSCGEIKRTIDFYNNIFDELDIPLLNMPKGTLKSYKNKTVNVPVELIELKYTDRWCDELIHSPFDKRVGFNWCWENNNDNEWLDDYKDVFTKQSPPTTEKSFLPNLSSGKSIAYYAPIFLGFVNTKWSNHYLNDVRSLNTTGFYDNYGGAYLTYYLKPLYEYVFGFNGVYFYDQTKPLGFIDKNNDLLFGDELMGKQLLDDYSIEDVGFLVVLYLDGDEIVGNQYQLWGSLNGLTCYMNDVIEMNDATSCFGDDYCTNLYLLYAPSVQKELGIR